MNTSTIGGISKTVWIVLAVVVVVGIWLVSSYNTLVSANEAVDNQWAQVETQYQRRFDLIPNLVASVQGIMKQEQKVFDDIATARTHYAGAATVDQKVAATNEVEGALGRLLVITENYPVLKSSDTVQTLMAQLEGTENRVSVERSRFNDIVQAYNLRVKRIPGSIFAAIFGFHERAYFQAATGAATAPTVNLQP